MPRFSALLGILAIVLAACGGASAVAPNASSLPNFELTVSGAGPGTGTYRSDAAASVNRCTHAADGSWRLMYVSAQPAINLDLLVGSGAETSGGASRVALEAEYGSGYFRFDPADMRGGDTAGRSTASIKVTPGSGSTTFAITAVTPDRHDGTDRDPIHVDMTVACAA